MNSNLSCSFSFSVIMICMHYTKGMVCQRDAEVLLSFLNVSYGNGRTYKEEAIFFPMVVMYLSIPHLTEAHLAKFCNQMHRLRHKFIPQDGSSKSEGPMHLLSYSCFFL